MARWQWVVVISTVLLLPACVFQPNKQIQKKSSQHLNGDGSIFASVSEESVRDEVRAFHATQPLVLSPAAHTVLVNEEEQALTPKQLHKRSKKIALERAAERQALLVDIPIPLNVKPLPRFFEQDVVGANQVVSLGYKIESATEEVVRFFKQGMERQGWRAMAAGSAGHEGVEWFVKPDRFCSVSVRPSSDKSKHKKPMVEIIIFTGPLSAHL